MKRKMFAALTLALCLLCGCATAQVLAPVANPMANYETMDDLRAALPNVPLFTAPDDAEDVTFATISGTIAQIEFTWQGDFYTMRAAKITDDDQLKTIHGVMMDFDMDEDEDTLKYSFAITQNVDELELETNRASAETLLVWMSRNTGVGYTLYSATAGNPDMRILKLLKERPEYIGATK